MLTLFPNHFSLSLIILSIAFTFGCATVSEQPSTVSHPPIDPEIPVQALLSEPSESVTANSHSQRSDAPETPVAPPATLLPPLMPVPLQVPSQANIQVVENSKTRAPSDADKKSPAVAITSHQMDCLPQLKEWKAEFTKKSEQTDKKLNELQATLNASQEKIARMETNQAQSKTEIERLKNQVDFYRREVIRLEQLMETQHAADLVILDSLTNQLGGLLNRAKQSNAY